MRFSIIQKAQTERMNGNTDGHIIVKLHEIISLLESNGWSISLPETGAELVDCYDLTIDYVIGEMGISKLKSAAASIKYCEKNNLEFLEENIGGLKTMTGKFPN